MSDFAIKDGQTVVMIGDSITDAGRRDQAAPLGLGYPRILVDLVTARYPERNIVFHNKGISGNTVVDLRDRWQDDVIAHQPDWLTINIGINDLHRAFNPGLQDVPVDRYETVYREILQLTCEKTSARIVLTDPFFITTDTDPRSFRGKVMGMLPAYIEVVEKMAQEFGTLHLKTHERFQNQLKYRPAETFSPEPVHPYQTGHTIIALGILELLGW